MPRLACVTTVTLAILGASGDLTHRLLLPGLGTLLKNEAAHEVTLVGCAVDELTQEAWVERVRDALEGTCPQARIDEVAARTRGT